MDINATLIGQIITFSLFVWFTMKFVWPPIMKAMQERQKRIADGLAAAEQGQRDLELAQHKSDVMLQDAKLEASRLIDTANQRSLHIVEEAKEKARQEGQRIIANAQVDIEQQSKAAQRDLQRHVAEIAFKMAEKIVQQSLDSATQQHILDNITLDEG